MEMPDTEARTGRENGMDQKHCAIHPELINVVCFRAARNKVDCRWETMFSPLEVQNALGV
jgi:hypothetical protein